MNYHILKPQFTRVNIAVFYLYSISLSLGKGYPTERGFPNALYLTLLKLMYL